VDWTFSRPACASGFDYPPGTAPTSLPDNLVPLARKSLGGTLADSKPSLFPSSLCLPQSDTWSCPHPSRESTRWKTERGPRSHYFRSHPSTAVGPTANSRFAECSPRLHDTAGGSACHSACPPMGLTPLGPPAPCASLIHGSTSLSDKLQCKTGCNP
jgi:hypothetical protein